MAAQCDGRSPGAEANDLVAGAGGPDAIGDPPHRDGVAGEAEESASRAAHGVDLAAGDREVVEADEQVAGRPVEGDLVAGHHSTTGLTIAAEVVEQ